MRDKRKQGNTGKGFLYVYFDFNMERGLAHVIGNHKKLKKDFVIKSW